MALNASKPSPNLPKIKENLPSGEGSRKLINQSHIDYCLARVEGMTKADAYLSSFPRCKSKAAAAKQATLLEKKTDIQEELTRLRNRKEDEMLLTARKKRLWLAGVLQCPDEPTINKLRALEIDNKMTGHNQPEQVDVNHGGGIIFMPRMDDDAKTWEEEAMEHQRSLEV